MRHADLKNLLQEYTEGNLDERDRKNVEAHLVTCEECRNELAWYRNHLKLMRSMPKTKAPAGFLSKVKSRIRESEGAPKKWWKNWLVPMEVAGLLAVSVFIVILILPQHRMGLDSEYDERGLKVVEEPKPLSISKDKSEERPVPPSAKDEEISQSGYSSSDNMVDAEKDSQELHYAPSPIRMAETEKKSKSMYKKDQARMAEREEIQESSLRAAGASASSGLPMKTMAMADEPSEEFLLKRDLSLLGGRILSQTNQILWVELHETNISRLMSRMESYPNTPEINRSVRHSGSKVELRIRLR